MSSVFCILYETLHYASLVPMFLMFLPLKEAPALVLSDISGLLFSGMGAVMEQAHLGTLLWQKKQACDRTMQCRGKWVASVY